MEQEKEILEKMKEAVIEGNEDLAEKISKKALEKGIDPLKALREGLGKGMIELGEKFERGDIYLPEIMIGADAYERAEKILLQSVTAEKVSEASKGTVVIGTVYGDIHDIGKSLVATLLRVNGYKIIDLGVDVPTKKFLETCKEVHPDILGLSCLLSSSLAYQEDVREWLEAEGMRKEIYFIVGGGPVNPESARAVKADGYGRYCEDAVILCNQLMEKKPVPPLGEPVIVGE